MTKKLALVLGLAGAFALAACSNSGTSIPSAPLGGLTQQSNVAASCGEAPQGSARCFALMRTDIGGGSPSGYHAPDPMSLVQAADRTAQGEGVARYWHAPVDRKSVV